MCVTRSQIRQKQDHVGYGDTQIYGKVWILEFEKFRGMDPSDSNLTTIKGYVLTLHVNPWWIKVEF